MKKILGLILVLFGFGFCFGADSYILYYGNGCTHCAAVEKFFQENGVVEKYKIEQKEIYFNNNNRNDFLNFVNNAGIPTQDQGVPLLVANESVGVSHYVGDKPIIAFFKRKLLNPNSDEIIPADNNFENDDYVSSSNNIGLGFFGVLLPAALADSINPCAFAVMLILMGSILSRYKSYKKLFLSGFLFILAIFISYVAMGLGLYKALASSSNTYYLKLFVGILGITVGLFNIKDYFWYGKGFVFEVPLS
ncbi:MAG: hypothetical protein V3575_00055, partial [Candidatus Absconditabacteria bacterium]